MASARLAILCSARRNCWFRHAAPKLPSAALAAVQGRASLRSIGFLSNRPLLWIPFERVLAAAVIYVPPLQDIFDTAALGPAELGLLALFPPLVWGSDELRRWVLRRR